MSQLMLYGRFKWIEPSLCGLSDISDTSFVGRVYEVDISYPESLHQSLNDMPFLPENGIPPGSKVTKLMATLGPRKNYAIHYRNLKQTIANGLIVDKVKYFIYVLIMQLFIFFFKFYRYIEYWNLCNLHGWLVI